VKLDARPQQPALLVGGLYRQWGKWSDGGLDRSVPLQREQMGTFLQQVEMAAAASRAVVVLGDVNLDAAREADKTYKHKQMLGEFQAGMSKAGLVYHRTGNTYTSHGHYKRTASALSTLAPAPTAPTPAPSSPRTTKPLAAVKTPPRTAVKAVRQSVLDHIYSVGVLLDVEVLPCAATDHRPLLASLGIREAETGKKSIVRRNFKAIESRNLCAALELHDWGAIYAMKGVDESLAHIMRGIDVALDVVAPAKTISVKVGDPLYLAADTRAAMRSRDAAARGGLKYKRLRNEANRMVRRDRVRSNVARLAKSRGDPRTVWQIASAALGQDSSQLPAALRVGENVMTEGDLEAATLMNGYYIDKVEKLKKGVSEAPAPPPSSWPEAATTFDWTYTTAGKVAKLVNGLGSTEAIGPDGVPVSVYKKGVDVLAGPIAHMVNRSLATGVFPDVFKHGVVLPIYKGGRKDRKEPASYRPVSILCALSKVLELTVRNCLQLHLDVSNNVPTSQHGFRKGRSCTTAIAAAHAAWIKGKKAGKVVGILAFDLSAAFDVCSADALLPKLAKVGVRPNAMRWFQSYLTGGQQRVCWNGSLSEETEVLYGVRQGSILGPLLFLIAVADMEMCVDVRGNAVFYADDSCIWACGNTVAEVVKILEQKASLFSRYVEGNGLVMNAGKSQLLLSKGGDDDDVFIDVNGSKVFPAATLSLLGVTFDRTLGVAPHSEAVVASARQRAAVVARLSHHLPRGEYLRQLAQGLFVGKLGHALPAVVAARLQEPCSSGLYRSAQVSMNDVCRTLTGTRRRDHKPVRELLADARFKSINEMAVEATAMEAWKAYVSEDGGAGERNPVGQLMFGPRCNVAKDARPTRSATAGIVPVDLRGQDTFVTHAAVIWNSSARLRSAKTIGEARCVAKLLARSAPL
jgi:hypothetical protein